MVLEIKYISENKKLLFNEERGSMTYIGKNI